LHVRKKVIEYNLNSWVAMPVWMHGGSVCHLWTSSNDEKQTHWISWIRWTKSEKWEIRWTDEQIKRTKYQKGKNKEQWN